MTHHHWGLDKGVPQTGEPRGTKCRCRKSRPGHRLVGGKRAMFSSQGEPGPSKDTQAGAAPSLLASAGPLRRRVPSEGTERAAQHQVPSDPLEPCGRSEGTRALEREGAG